MQPILKKTNQNEGNKNATNMGIIIIGHQNVAVKTYSVTDVVVMDTSKVYAGLRIDKTEMSRYGKFLSIVMGKPNVIIAGNLATCCTKLQCEKCKLIGHSIQNCQNNNTRVNCNTDMDEMRARKNNGKMVDSVLRNMKKYK